jgi:HSP20 family protein
MNPLEDSFEKLARSMESMMRGITRPMYFQSSGRDFWEPRINVYELADRIVVCVELAGIEPGDLDVQVHDCVLHIRGHRNKPTVPESSGDIGVHLMEIDSGRFHRQIRVPSDLDLDLSKASYRNGYVWIALPRRARTTAEEQ